MISVRIFFTLLMLVYAGGVQGQTDAGRAIRLIVPFPGGSGSDVLARQLAPRLGGRLQERIVVDNRPGAAGVIGVQYASKAAPDGHTLLFGSTSELALYPATSSTQAYDTLRDFIPVASLSEVALVLLVHPSLPANSIGDLVHLAKLHPGEISYGSPGLGVMEHLSMAVLCRMMGVDLVHVPSQDGQMAVASLISGHVQAMMAPLSAVLTHTASGRLRALAVSSARRWPAMPQLPTVAESGLKGYAFTRWTGVLAPANTPAEIVARVYRGLAEVMMLPEMERTLAAQGALAEVRNPEGFRALIERETVKWARASSLTNVRLE